MINYFNFKKINDEYLITNDFGRYAFLSINDFRELVISGEVQNTEVRNRLYCDKFIYNTSLQSFVDDNSYLIHDAKEYLFHSTQLHIFVVTNACNMQCVYCQAQNGDRNSYGFMSREVAKKAVDIAIQSPSNHLQFEFQGGEPLLNFEIIKFIVEYANETNNGKKIDYSIVTNLTLLTSEILDFIKENKISISTSLDGDMLLHDKNRPFCDGSGTYQIVRTAINTVKFEGVPIGALQTTSKESLKKWREIIDTYIELGFDTISLRPLTPLGCANNKWEFLGYSAKEFIDFYKNAFEYILEINKNKYFREGIASIFLKKILEGLGVNYMELRSPCGAVLGQIAYYFDGNIYTCDEGRMVSEMGDKSFCIGNVYESEYKDLIENDVCKVVCSTSVLETLPSCSDCVYQPYCGVCPVVNFALNENVYEKHPNDYRCEINKGILDILFTKLQDNREEVKWILRGWIK